MQRKKNNNEKKKSKMDYGEENSLRFIFRIHAVLGQGRFLQAPKGQVLYQRDPKGTNLFIG